MNHQVLMLKMLITFAYKSLNATQDLLKKIKEIIKIDKYSRSYKKKIFFYCIFDYKVLSKAL